jgi:hypothetical protein
MASGMWRYHRDVRPYFKWLIKVAHVLGLDPRVTSTVRSRGEQSVLYDRYLRGLSKFPAAPPGRSLHERGLAIDLVSRDPELLGRYWKYYIGGRWSPTDSVHYDLQPWL